ncbi:MAG: hypothetical protein R3E66_21000 [bacterium]
MKTLASLTTLIVLAASATAQAWTLTPENGPSVTGVTQRLVVLHDGSTQTLLWSPTVDVSTAGRVTLLFAIPAPPSKVERLGPTAVEEIEKVAQISFLSAAKKRGDEPAVAPQGAVVGSKELSVNTLTSQGDAAKAALDTLLGDMGLKGPSSKELAPYVADNWSFAAISWDAKPGVQTLGPLRIDFQAPVGVLLLKSLADLGGTAQVFVLSGTPLADAAERELTRNGFEIAADRRKLGPNPKRSTWVSGQTSFYIRNLSINPKNLFLERFSVQRGFVTTLIVEDVAKAAKRWKTEPHLGDAKTDLRSADVEVVAPSAPAEQASDADAGGADAGVAPTGEPVIPEGVSDALSDAWALDWTMILGVVGVLFFLTAVTVVQVRRRL